MANGGAEPPDPGAASETRADAPADVPDAAAEAAFRLLDNLAECVMVLRPITDSRGQVADFVIDHVNHGYCDSVGRVARDLIGNSLLVAYAAEGVGENLFSIAMRVLAGGAPLHRPGVVPGLCGPDDPVGMHAVDLRAVRFARWVVFTWRRLWSSPGQRARDGDHGRSSADRRATDALVHVALEQTLDLLADSEQRAAAEHELAVRLQHVIMPSGRCQVDVEGVDIAVRYRPAEVGRLVAGDWYDTLELPCGDLLLVVGDIAGHGIDAVTGMVAARNALRWLAVSGSSPSELIAQLNIGACNYANATDGITGTVICGQYSPGSRELRWARAGHLPPVLVRDEVARALPLPDGPLLGLDPDACYEEITTRLRSGDTLLLYTDGLIERRAASISDALADFVTAAVPSCADADATASRILAQAGSDTGDDACLVAIRIL